MGEWNNCEQSMAEQSSTAGKANLYITVFWPWFPLGFAGIRTGLLCIASMAIYVLRVSQMHS